MHVRRGDEGQSMSDLNFKRIVNLFVLCTTFFPTSYYNVLSQYLSFLNNIENFENYPWGVDAYEEILRELSLQNETLWKIKFGEESKNKEVYLRGCTVSLHYFVLKHLPDCETDLFSVVSPRMLK